jgi:hypothetical protein
MMMHRAALLVACCACAVAQTAAIEGVVVNQPNGRPMPGVQIGFALASPSGDAQPFGAMSDGKGHFSISNLPAGTYVAGAQARGFFYVPPGNQGPVRLVSLKAGQQMADFKIEMAPEATIAGRVFDDYGDPVQTQVRAELDSDRVMYVGPMGDASSDERGEFHLSVAPGKYYVVAEPVGRVFINQAPEVRTDGSVEAIYGRTYHPGATAKAKAVPVEAAAGAELTGIDIHMARQGRAFSIGGTVTGVTEGATAMVTLQQGDDAAHIGATMSMGTRPDGRFLFTNREPGAYQLLGYQSNGKTKLYSQLVDVNLDGGDATGVNLVLGPGGELHGKLEIAGGAGAEKFFVSLESGQYGHFGDPSPSAEVERGAFPLTDIAPGHYHLKVTPLEENAYLKSVRLDDAEAPEDDLDLTRLSPASSLKIVVSRNGGQITGKLLDKNGDPLGPGLAMVLLASDGTEIDLEHSLKTTEDGTYRFQAIRPGKYRLLAFGNGQFGWGGDFREKLKKLAAAAETIEIKEGDRKVQDIKLTAEEGADAKANQ